MDVAPLKLKGNFEKQIVGDLLNTSVPFSYEPHKIPYTLSLNYIPDLYLSDKNLYIELKGVLDATTKQKMIAVKNQHPDKDIRIVFQRASNKLHPKSKLTYGDWAEKNGFIWADKRIPSDWLT